MLYEPHKSTSTTQMPAERSAVNVSYMSSRGGVRIITWKKIMPAKPFVKNKILDDHSVHRPPLLRGNEVEWNANALLSSVRSGRLQ
jgi:hypothetical protein